MTVSIKRRQDKLEHVVQRLRTMRPGHIPFSRTLFKLSWAWGNHGYAASISYLKSICARVEQQRGPVLECGCGATTLLLGCLAEVYDFECETLEHDAFWARRMRKQLRELGLNRIHVHHVPLKTFDGFDWYGAAPKLDAPYKVVVCDGPPGSTPGGRYGLLPVMKENLADDVIILLDDVHRRRERQVLNRWMEIRPFKIHTDGLFKMHACAVGVPLSATA